MKRKIVIITIVCVGIAIGCYLWNNGGNGDPADDSQATTVRPTHAPIQLKIESTGRVVSNLDVEIKCKASGEVTGVPYDVSDPVKKADLLVELDPIDEERRVKQAEVNLSSSKARLVQAQQNLKTAERDLTNDMARAQAALKSARVKFQDAHAKAERTKKLLEANRVSIEENETAQTAASLATADLENAKITLAELEVKKDALEVLRQDVALAEDQVESNEIELEMARQRLKDTKVFAPIDGVVADRQVEVGQIISSPTSNVGGGTTLLVLSDLSRLFVLASVDESDIGTIEVGQRVTITADAFPDKEFYGKVVRVAARGEN
ncbi:MAG TPA: HlyD family efflux transporter periplasmic adaptor subunit, partial [bacterium]|nr:HlyD family efflux transporter periplasmic adaptor subunit [bacterium]